jgi:LysR family transcriptional activator of nhaA
MSGSGVRREAVSAPVEWLNYHHLLYFYTVAREGTMRRAAEVLRLAQPTLSGQIRKLEESLGEKLFARQGRNLVLTEMGKHVYAYADEIFSLGREMMGSLRGHAVARPARLVVGIADVVPKLICHRLLAPAVEASVQLVLREGKTDDLLAGLAVQAYELVIADAPLGPHLKVRAFNHLLGECGVAFLAAPAVAKALHGRFPKCLDGAPLLLPTENTVLRRSLAQWFEQHAIRPRVVAEVEDSALAKVFGQAGAGVFPVPDVVAADVMRTYHVRQVGRTDEVCARFYAISAERRIKSPAAALITERARGGLFR